MKRFVLAIVAAIGCLAAAMVVADDSIGDAWPPALAGAKDGTATLTSDTFLRIPEKVVAARSDPKAAPFELAKVPPTVELAYHRDLGPDAQKRRLWSCWGDICVAGDGRVYCGLGDHGDEAKGDARAFIYRWDPARHVLERVVDLNTILSPDPSRPAWSKVHAKIDEGPDGKIYFSGTLNDGNRAGKPEYHWGQDVPGGQLYQFDPQTGRATVFASLPPKRCTATSLVDRERNVWWCNLEAGEGNALWALDLKTRKPIFQAPEGSMAFNRNFALARNGAIYFNGSDAIWKYDPATKQIAATKSAFSNCPGMRCSTGESRDGAIYGVTYGSNELFRYRPARDQLEMLGPCWLTGAYTTVCVLSPDERFLYYLPGSHGGAFREGTPVIQYDIASKRQKVLAFLAEPINEKLGYVPAGTYGVKLSTDGGTLFVNFNGHAADRLRPAKMQPNGFGLCAFAAIHIPAAER